MLTGTVTCVGLQRDLHAQHGLSLAVLVPFSLPSPALAHTDMVTGVFLGNTTSAFRAGTARCRHPTPAWQLLKELSWSG